MDKLSVANRSKLMATIRSKNTKPELALRRVLWLKGYRFRIHYGKEKIDIAFPGKKIAIFVDGCFWHSCPIHSHAPKSNRQYWLQKLERNVQRDRLKEERLRSENWTIVRVWEHDLKTAEDITGVAEKILALEVSSKPL
jgi:DNA mismatch endonuclease, patch repair protein